jgi:xylulokinase
VLGIPVDIPADGDYGAAFGAARLGLVAAESADPLAICTPPATAEVVEPDVEVRQSYEEVFGRYRALYPAIKGARA